MRLLNISEAKSQLSSVIEKVVTRGEEFVIGKAGKPVAKIIPFTSSKRNHRLGCLKGKIKISPDFDEWPDDLSLSLGLK